LALGWHGAAMAGRAVDPLMRDSLPAEMQETNQSSEKKRDLPKKAWICAKSDQKVLVKRFM